MPETIRTKKDSRDKKEFENYINKNRGLSDEEVRKRGLEALHHIREQAKKREHEFTMDEINEIIAETRRENNYAY